ncbi:hypothetical protein RND81_01G049500 [Saponaria officinalis]|uniref:protein-serine/threonine phosphatase n=1 Tax=Saponaria officinalis TaxID=3572 RepID=A0AAW1NEA1_SAPOF
MSVAVSNSPVFSPKHHHYHHNTSIFSSPTTLSPRPCSPLSRTAAASPPSAVVAKRKRPTRLDIPIMPMEFSSVGTPAPRGGGCGEVEEERDGFYSVCCKKGRRSFLEDRFSAEVEIHGDSKKAIFGVFDGHGGPKAAEYAAENLNKNIIAEIENKANEVDIEEAVKLGYMKTDSDFLEGELKGGSCCVTAFIAKGDLVVSNAGDCRAVMSRGGVAEALTTDHRPSRPDEKDRIEAKGGYIDCYNGVWRIQGSLAVSRGIGDRQLKQWVVAEPESRVIKISQNDEFLILASDGLWDKVTNQEAVDTVRPLCIDSNKPQRPSLAACKKLVDVAVSRGSLDDVSVMIVPLEQYIQ